GFDRVGGLDAALDGAPGDAALAGGDGGAGSPCATPTLLIAMGAPASSARGGGAIVRFALDPVTGIPKRCSTLTAGGNLPADVRTVTARGGDVALVAANTVVLLDGAHDTER